MKMRAFAVGLLVLGLVTPGGAFAPGRAFAQDDQDDENGSAEAGDGSDVEAWDEASEAQPEEKADETNADADADADKASADAPRNWYFGPFARYVWVPAFMLELFLEQAPTLGNGSIGIVADHRSTDGGPTLEIGLGYTGYQFDGPMQAKGDPETDTEWVESDLGLIHVTGSVLWETGITKSLAFEYGVGLDLGILVGNLVRTEAYKEGGTFHKCPGPDLRSAYCELPTNPLAGTDAYDANGAHYNVVEKRVPPIGGGFMLPHLALRFEPVPEVALKLEAAYGIVQFWLGLSASYAPKI